MCAAIENMYYGYSIPDFAYLSSVIHNGEMEIFEKFPIVVKNFPINLWIEWGYVFVHNFQKPHFVPSSNLIRLTEKIKYNSYPHNPFFHEKKDYRVNPFNIRNVISGKLVREFRWNSHGWLPSFGTIKCHQPEVCKYYSFQDDAVHPSRFGMEYLGNWSGNFVEIRMDGYHPLVLSNATNQKSANIIDSKMTQWIPPDSEWNSWETGQAISLKFA